MYLKFRAAIQTAISLLFVNLALGGCSAEGTSGSWYEGGTLNDATALEWQDASYSNKLATCADFVAKMDSDGQFVASVDNDINTIEDIRPYAEDLVTALDGAFAEEDDPERNRQMYANQSVAETAVILMQVMGWTR